MNERKTKRQKRHMVPIHDVHYETFDLITTRMSGVSRIWVLDADGFFWAAVEINHEYY